MITVKILRNFEYAGIIYHKDVILNLSLNEMDRMGACNFEILKCFDAPPKDKMIKGRESLISLMLK